MSTTTLIVGDTYPVRAHLAALGGAWDAKARGWRVPTERAEEARALVAAAPSTSPVTTRPAYNPARIARATGPRVWRPCGYPGCSREYCDECDGAGR